MFHLIGLLKANWYLHIDFSLFKFSMNGDTIDISLIGIQFKLVLKNQCEASGDKLDNKGIENYHVLFTIQNLTRLLAKIICFWLFS